MLQAANAVAFSCNMFPSAEPSPKPAGPGNSMAHSANSREPEPGGQQADQKGPTAGLDVPSAATGRQGRLLQMMQRAQAILRGRSQCTQSQTTGSNVSLREPSYSPDLRNPGPTAQAKPDAAVVDHIRDPDHHEQARSQLPLHKNIGEAGAGVGLFQKRAFDQVNVQQADSTCNGNANESALRKAIQAALQKTTGSSNETSKCTITSLGGGACGGGPTFSQHPSLGTDHAEGVAEGFIEKKPGWDQFTPDQAGGQNFQKRAARTACESAGVWSHSQPTYRGIPWNFRQPGTHWQGRAAGFLRKTLQSDGVPSLDAGHNTDLQQGQIDNHKLDMATESQACDGMHTKQLTSAFMEAASGGKPDIGGAGSLMGPTCEAEKLSTSPAEVGVESMTCNAPSAGTHCIQSGATRHAQSVSEGRYASPADGQIRTTSWACTQMYCPTHLTTVQTNQAVSPLFSDDKEFSSMKMPGAVAELKPRATRAQLIDESSDCERAQTADHFKSSFGNKSCGHGSEFEASRSTLHVPIHQATPHGGGETCTKRTAQAANVASHSATSHSPCSLTCSGLPDSQQNRDIKESESSGKSIRNALGRLRQALRRQSKHGPCSANSSRITSLGSGAEGSDRIPTILSGDDAAMAKDTHISALRKKVDSPVCTQRKNAAGDIPKSCTSGKPNKDTEAAPVDTALKSSDSPSPQHAFVPTSDVHTSVACAGLRPSQDHGVPPVDTSAKVQTPPTSPPRTPPGIPAIKLQRLECEGALPQSSLLQLRSSCGVVDSVGVLLTLDMQACPDG